VSKPYHVSIEYGSAPDEATAVTIARDSATSTDESEDEFGRFEALTSKLLRVPKTEVDEKRNRSTSAR
jgi:hypothetical protein